MLLGILGNPWTLQDGRVEVDPNPAVPAGYLPMVNPEIPAEPIVTRTRNEENDRRINFTKRVVSDFGATLAAGVAWSSDNLTRRNVEPGLPHGWRTILRTRSGSKTNLNRRNDFANPETTVAVPIEGRTDATKRARQEELEAPQEYADTGGASGSSAEVDVDIRMVHAGKRPLDPGGDKDVVCGLDVCDELDELDENSFSDTYVNDLEGDYTDEVTGVTLLRDDVAKARMEEMKQHEKFQAFDEVPDETCVLRTGRKPVSCRWRDINEGGSERVEVRSRLVAREIKHKGTDSYIGAGALRDKQSCNTVNIE